MSVTRRACGGERSAIPDSFAGKFPLLFEDSKIPEFVKQAAKTAGFDLVGIAPVREFSELNYFPEWIAAGHGGEME